MAGNDDFSRAPLVAIAVLSLVAFGVDWNGRQAARVAAFNGGREPVHVGSAEGAGNGVRLSGNRGSAMRRCAVSAGRAGSLLASQAESESVGEGRDAGVLIAKEIGTAGLARVNMRR